MTDNRNRNDPRHVAAVLDFMAKAAEATRIRQCESPGCARLTLRRVCDHCAGDDTPPPRAA